MGELRIRQKGDVLKNEIETLRRKCEDLDKQRRIALSQLDLLQKQEKAQENIECSLCDKLKQMRIILDELQTNHQIESSQSPEEKQFKKKIVEERTSTFVYTMTSQHSVIESQQMNEEIYQHVDVKDRHSVASIQDPSMGTINDWKSTQANSISNS